MKVIKSETIEVTISLEELIETCNEVLKTKLSIPKKLQLASVAMNASNILFMKFDGIVNDDDV
jgi:hypothetical protein